MFSFHLSVSHFDALDEPSLHEVEPQDAAPHVSVGVVVVVVVVEEEEDSPVVVAAVLVVEVAAGT